MKIIIGSAQFGLNYGIANNYLTVESNEIIKILNLAKKNKINTIDTAAQYGTSEKKIGEIINSDFFINTKLPFIDNQIEYSTLWLEKKINKSLNNLKVKSLNSLFIHNIKDLLDLKNTTFINDLNLFKKKGYFKSIGISIYSPKELDKVIDFFKPDIVQAPYNIFDQRIEITGWLEKLNNLDIEFHARSVFLQGILLDQKFINNKFFSKWSFLFNKWFQWCNENGISPLDASLAKPMNNININKIVVGVNSEFQLNEIIYSCKKQIKTTPDFTCDDEELLNPYNWKF